MSLKILLIDDDGIEADYTRRILQREAPGISFAHVLDGIDGLAFLRGEEKFRHETPPDLVLLDMHMPRMDGPSFLETRRQDEALKRIPVVVLLASHDLRDMIASRELNVDAYLVKPITFADLTKVLDQLQLHHL